MRRRLAFLLVLPLVGAPAAARRPPPPTEEPSPYATVVVGERPPEGLSAQAVRRESIRRLGARSAADVLEQTPSAHASTGSRGERTVSLRGFDPRQTVVLLDGAPFQLPYDGQVDLGLFPAAALEQVTLLKGPASVVHGPGGLGGAVSLVTRSPGSGPLLEAHGEGSPSALRVGARHAARAGEWGWSLHGGLQQRRSFPLSGRFEPALLEDGGRRENSDRRLVHAGAEVGWDVAPEHRLRGTVLFLDGARGVPPSVSDDLPRFWRFTTWRALAASLTHEAEPGSRWSLDEQLYLRRFDNLLDAFDDARYRTQDTARGMHSWFHDRVLGGRLRARYARPTPLGELAVRAWLGVQHDRHDEEPGTAPVSRTLLTAAPELALRPHPALRVTAGAQADVELPGDLPGASTDPAWSVGPLLAVRYSPFAAFMARVSAARRTRFPTLKERFSGALGTRLPNPELAPEGAWHLGLDVSWRPWRPLRLEASAFDAEVRGLIDRVHLGGGVDQMQNLGEARLAGAELAARLVLPRLELRAGYLWLHARRLDTPDQRLAYRPAHRATASATLRPAGWLEVSAFVRVVGPQDYQDPQTRLWGTLGTYAVLDARAEVAVARDLRVWFRGTNVLDANYQTELGFPDPGRELWLGAQLALGRPPEAP